MSLPFFNTRAKRRDEVIAIDLGGRHTKAVRVQNKGERLSLVSYTIQDSPSEVSGGASVEVLAEHLKSVSRALGDGTRGLRFLSSGWGSSVATVSWSSPK